MAASGFPQSLRSCPTDEDLAAFLDGFLPATERARITAHLAVCASCLELFAQTIYVPEDAGRIVGGGKVLPFPSRRGQEAPARKLEPPTPRFHPPDAPSGQPIRESYTIPSILDVTTARPHRTLPWRPFPPLRRS